MGTDACFLSAGTGRTFLLYGFFLVFMLIFVLTSLPETKNVSLEVSAVGCLLIALCLWWC